MNVFATVLLVVVFVVSLSSVMLAFEDDPTPKKAKRPNRHKEFAPGYTLGEKDAGYSFSRLLLKYDGRTVGESEYISVYGLGKTSAKMRTLSWERHDLRLDGQPTPTPAKPKPPRRSRVTGHLTQYNLENLPTGSKVRDCDGDDWTKQADGRYMYGANTSLIKTPQGLLTQWGPVVLVGATFSNGGIMPYYGPSQPQKGDTLDLTALPPGSKVRDTSGDIWTRGDDGLYTCHTTSGQPMPAFKNWTPQRLSERYATLTLVHKATDTTEPVDLVTTFNGGVQEALQDIRDGLAVVTTPTGSRPVRRTPRYRTEDVPEYGFHHDQAFGEDYR